MRLRNALLFATLALTACQTHHHALNITSDPSAQAFEVEAWDEHGKMVFPLTLHEHPSGLTPYQVMYPEKVANAEVKLTFSQHGGTDVQTKVVQFGHPYTDFSVYREPFLGLPLGSTVQVKIKPQTVHFDKR